MKPTIQDKVKRTLADLRGLRDEIRLNIHLVGMDVKSTWQKLEQEIDEADRRVSAAGKKASRELAESLGKLRGRVIGFRDHHAQDEKPAPPPAT